MTKIARLRRNVRALIHKVVNHGEEPGHGGKGQPSVNANSLKPGLRTSIVSTKLATPIQARRSCAYLQIMNTYN